MDRRLLAFGVVVFAACTLVVSVVVVGFVGVEGLGEEYEVVWATEPVDEFRGDDVAIGVAAVDGDPVFAVPATDGENCGITALDGDGEERWSDTDASDDCTPPVVGAIVGGAVDGEPTFVVVDAAGRLRIYDAATGAVRFEYDVGEETAAPPVIADVTGDGVEEIVVADFGGTVHVVDADTGGDDAADDAEAEAVWTLDAGGTIANRPLVSDVTGDGDPEVAIAVRDGSDGEILLLDTEGDERWRADAGPGITSWTVATPEEGAGGGTVLVAGLGTGNVVAYEGETGDVRWDTQLQDGSVRTGDISPGRVLVAGTGAVWSVDLEDGGVVWRQQVGERGRIAAPAVGDVVGDDDLEVVAVGSGGTVGVLAARTGSVDGLDEVDGRYHAGPQLVDVTGDGTAEIVLLRHDGTVVVLSVLE